MFSFADKYRGTYSDGLKSYVCPFYCSYSGYHDELLWGAAWLQKATRSRNYLSYIQMNGQILGANENDNTLSWDNKHAGAKILLSKVIFNVTFYFQLFYVLHSMIFPKYFLLFL